MVAQRLLEERAAPRILGLIMSEWRGFGPASVGGGWLVDELLFKLLVDFEIQKAQRLRYSISVVCVAIGSSAAGNGEASTAIAESITRYLRGTDAVASWAQGWLSLLLIDAETAHLPLILERLTTRLETVGWSAGGSCYPRTATRAEDMLRQAVDLMGRAKEAGGNRLYVAS
jgi:GGDEF domain-containing protein